MSLQHSYQALAEQEWIDIPTGWLQGRTIYGGLVAGLMMQKALLTLADDTKHLLSCSVTFCWPSTTGQSSFNQRDSTSRQVGYDLGSAFMAR